MRNPQSSCEGMHPGIFPVPGTAKRISSQGKHYLPKGSVLQKKGNIVAAGRFNEAAACILSKEPKQIREKNSGIVSV